MAHELLRASADTRARLALAAGDMGSFAASLTRDVARGDERVCALFGLPYSEEARPIQDFLDRIHPDDRASVHQAIEDAWHSGVDYVEEFRVGHGDEWRWIAGRGRIVSLDDGDAMLVGINWDITRRKLEQERLAIMAQEMDHRVKNAFSVITALVRLAARSADSPVSFAETLTSQLRAMADAHRMSTQTAKLDGEDRVRLLQIVRMAIAPWLTGDADRVALIEEAPVTLPLHQVSAFAMLAYELATNAAKYGALGTSDGRLRVTIGRHDEDTALFSWDETADGQAAIQAEEEREKGAKVGFGTTLLQHCAATLRAHVKRELRPQGLLVELRIPVERL